MPERHWVSLPSSFFTLSFKTGSLKKTWSLLIGQDYMAKEFPGSSWFQCLGTQFLIINTTTLAFICKLRGSELGPHAFRASTLPTEPSQKTQHNLPSPLFSHNSWSTLYAVDSIDFWNLAYFLLHVPLPKQFLSHKKTFLCFGIPILDH